VYLFRRGRGSGWRRHWFGPCDQYSSLGRVRVPAILPPFSHAKQESKLRMLVEAVGLTVADLATIAVGALGS
jgi:hypothetical protein